MVSPPVHTNDAAGAITRLADDLPLFAHKPAAKEEQPTSPLADEFAKLRPDELTHKEALEALYRLKGLSEE